VRGASMIIAPFTMALLSPADYGLLALINSFISIFVVIIGCGLRQALSIEYFHRTAEDQKKIINDIALLYIICGFPLLAAGMYSLVIYPHLFFNQLTFIQIVAALINIIGVILFLWFFAWGIESMLLATLLGMMVSFLCALYVYVKHRWYLFLHAKRSIQNIYAYLRLGVPFIAPLLLSIMLGSGNRFLLAHYATLHEVGIYALADSFGQLFNAFILIPFSGSYHPYILTQYAQHKENILAVEHANQRTMFVAMMTLAIAIIGGYIVGKPILYYLFPAKFHQVIEYIPYILYGYVFLLGQYFVSALIQFQKCTWFLSCALIMPAALNMMLGYLLIPLFTIYGCLIASLCAYASFFMITWWFNRKVMVRIHHKENFF
jgi:O-antigen/teichoic acid export membrane protein